MSRSVLEIIKSRTQALETEGYTTEEARRIATETLTTINRKPIKAGRVAA